MLGAEDGAAEGWRRGAKRGWTKGRHNQSEQAARYYCWRKSRMRSASAQGAHQGSGAQGQEYTEQGGGSG